MIRLIILAGTILAEQVCTVVPYSSLQEEFGKCLPSCTAIPYSLSIGTSNSYVGCKLTISLEGDFSKTEEVPFTTDDKFVRKDIVVYSPPIGNLKQAIIRTRSKGCTIPFTCNRVTVYDSHRMHRLECDQPVSSEGDTMELLMSGVTMYRAIINTDIEVEANLRIQLIGKDGSNTAWMALLHGVTQPHRSVQTTIFGNDIGAIDKIVVENKAKEPFRFIRLVLISESGTVSPFVGGQFIGTPYADRVEFSSNSGSLDIDNPIPIYCHTRLVDILTASGIEELGWVTVKCPTGCEELNFAYSVGLGLHSASSAICPAAIADGILSIAGGTLFLSVHPSDSRAIPVLFENVPAGRSEVSAVPFAGATGLESSRADPFWTAALVSTIDDIVDNYRLVNVFGEISNTGRLEIRIDNVWNSVCMSGVIDGGARTFSAGSAHLLCVKMGYLTGYILDNCSELGLCGSAGMDISGPLLCKGNEVDVSTCDNVSRGESCTHQNDVVINCTNRPIDQTPEAGALRLVTSSGTVASTGVGRLEFWNGIAWASICNDEWNFSSALVACKQMGYTGVSEEIPADDENRCENVRGANLCGSINEVIAGMTNVVCDGSEFTLIECSKEIEEDIYCVPSENVVLSCKGDGGDPSGIGKFTNTTEAIKFSELYIPMPVDISCETTLNDYNDFAIKAQGKSLTELIPGEMVVIRCPANCGQLEKALVFGSIVYSPSSSICRAGIASGLSATSPYTAVITVTHGNFRFPQSTRHEIHTLPQEGLSLNGFTVSRVSPSMAARTARTPQLSYSGISRLPRDWINQRLNVIDYSRNVISFLDISNSEKSIANKPAALVCNENQSSYVFDGTTSVRLGHILTIEHLEATAGFSMVMKFKMDESESWRTLLSDNECDGFSLSLNGTGELHFEQMCSPFSINTGLVAKTGDWNILTVTFDLKTVMFSLNHEPVSFPLTTQFSLDDDMVIANGSRLGFEAFTGQIEFAMIYDRPVNDNLISYIEGNLAYICYLNTASTVPAPIYSDNNFRMCISPCHDVGDAREPVKVIGERKENILPVILTCESSLSNTEIFSGKIGDSWVIQCPVDCLALGSSDELVPAGVVFPGEFPICVAMILSSLSHGNHGSAVLELKPGTSGAGPASWNDLITKYGHRALENDVHTYGLKPTSVPKELDCNATAEFITLSSTPGSSHIFRCPSDCSSLEIPPAVFAASTPVCRSAVSAGMLSSKVGGLVLLNVASIGESSGVSSMIESPHYSKLETRGYNFSRIAGGYYCAPFTISSQYISGVVHTPVICDSTALSGAFLYNGSIRINAGKYAIDISDSGCTVRSSEKQKDTSFFNRGVTFAPYLSDHSFLATLSSSSDEFDSIGNVSVITSNDLLQVTVNGKRCYSGKISPSLLLADPVKIVGYGYIESFVVNTNLSSDIRI